MKILEWPQFQIAHVWILFVIISIIALVFIYLYYLNSIEKQIYVFFLSISKKKQFEIKEMELFIKFYHYYKQKYSLWKRKKEISDTNILKKRLFEWFFDKLQYDKELTLSFMRILRHLLFKYHLWGVSSISDIENHEPVVIIIDEEHFSLGIVVSIQEKPKIKMIIKLFKPEILNQNNNNEADIFLYRPSSGDYKVKVKYNIIKDEVIQAVPVSDFEAVSFRLVSTRKLYGSMILKHKKLLFETKEIEFYTERFSMKGLKIFPSKNLKNELSPFLKEHNLDNLNWDDYHIKIQIALDEHLFSLEGTIKDIYKQEKNCYLILFNYKEDQSNLKKIFMNFIKNNEPVTGDL